MQFSGGVMRHVHWIMTSGTADYLNPGCTNNAHSHPQHVKIWRSKHTAQPVNSVQLNFADAFLTETFTKTSQEPNSLIARLCAPAGIGKSLGFKSLRGIFTSVPHWADTSYWHVWLVSLLRMAECFHCGYWLFKDVSIIWSYSLSLNRLKGWS